MIITTAPALVCLAHAVYTSIPIFRAGHAKQNLQETAHLYRLLLHMTTQQILGLETRDNATCYDVTNIFLHVRETLLFFFSLKTKKNGHLRTPYLE